MLVSRAATLVLAIAAVLLVIGLHDARALRESATASSFSLSNVFGDSMVLQRAPQQAVVWGWAASGVSVTASLDGKQVGNVAVAGADNVWRVTLPAMPASPASAAAGHVLSFSSSDGGSATLHDVLFGDVFLCGGQSNMQFTVHSANDAAAEIAKADAYPYIRLFTVGQGTSSDTPLDRLKTIEQGWTRANHTSVGFNDWGYFSAVCWLFGRNVSDAMPNKIPIGLLSNNWGGTSVQQWSSPEALRACGASGSGNLWNAMIVPYTVGPMALRGATWYQGESNVGAAAYYECQFPKMIADWRNRLGNPNLWFGFVQIAGWGGYSNNDAAGDLRDAQMVAVTKLPAVGYSTAIDVGNFADIHPKDKQTVASRLALSALQMVYNLPQAQHWQCPQFASVTSGTVTTTLITVNIRISLPTGDKLSTHVPRAALAAGSNACPAGKDAQCGFPTIYIKQGANIVALRASAALGTDGQSLIFTAPNPDPKVTTKDVVATSYGRGNWPVLSFWSTPSEQPLLSWYASS